MTLTAELGHACVSLEADGFEAWPGLVAVARGAWLGAAPNCLATGDAAFDRALVLVAPNEDAAGLFDAPTRSALMTLAAAGGGIEGARPWAEVTLAAPVDPNVVLDAMKVLRARLMIGASVARREILRIAEEDLEASVRHAYTERAARIPELAMLASERRIAKGDRDPEARFLALREALYDAKLPRDVRRKALVAVIRELGLERAATLEPVWTSWAGDARLHDAIGEALEARPGEIGAARSLLARIYGASPAQWQILLGLATLLIDGVGRDGAIVPGDRTAFLRAMAGHPVEAIANHARMRLAERCRDLANIFGDHPNDEALAATLAIAPVRMVVLETLAGALGDGDAAQVRRLARHVVFESARDVFFGLDDSHFLRRWIAAELRAGDVDAVPALRAIAGHSAPAVRMDALHALLAIGEEEDVLAGSRGLLPAEVLTIARRGGRHAATMIVKRLPPNAGDSTKIAFLEALAAVGGEREAEFAERHLDDAAKDVVIAALATLGAIGGPASVKRIAPLGAGFFRDGEIKDAARAAVDYIRARSAPMGALSVSGDGGELTLDRRED